MPECESQPQRTVAPDVFCPADLLKRCLGKHEFARRIVDRFLGTLPIELQALEAAHQAGDVVCVARIAHRLKGASANIAANRLRMLAAEVEMIGSQQRLLQMGELLSRLKMEADLFARVARQWREGNPEQL